MQSEPSLMSISHWGPEKRIIDLSELRGQDDFPAYAAVYSSTGV